MPSFDVGRMGGMRFFTLLARQNPEDKEDAGRRGLRDDPSVLALR